MATAVVRAMTLGQNIHMIPNNCVYVSSTNVSPNNGVTLIHHGKRPIAPAPEHRTNNILGNNNSNNNNYNNNHNNNNNNNNNSNNNNNNNNSLNDLRCKKRMNYSPITYGGNQPNSVARRNARERNRVQLVNNGFTNLRQHIPPDIVNALTNGGRGASKKLSKVDTLKMAVEYIRRLQSLLDDADNDTASTSTCTSKNLSLSSSYYVDSSTHHSLPPCSETSSSPTPSFTSESSISCNIKTYAPSIQYTHHDHCDSYGSMNSLDDDLLDVISSWQQE